MRTLLACLALAGCATTAAPPPIRLILVGDSTLASNNGYGDALCARLNATCVNVAKNGRSSGSFRAEGLWDEKVMAALRSGGAAYAKSYVLIEFGHNDQPGKPGRSTDLKTEFPVNLARYVDEVRAAGGIPLLATPLTRRSFDKQGVLQNDLQPWADTTRRIATEKRVPLIDLLAASGAAVQAMGSADADTLAVEPPPLKPAPDADRNQVERVTTAKSAFDHTHVGPKGAKFFAAMVERLLREQVPALTPYFSVNRPQLTAEQASHYGIAEVLDGWNPQAEPISRGPADYTVDGYAFKTIQAAVNQAIVDARKPRVRIAVRPGIYRELVYVPASSTAITIEGLGASPADTVITSSLDAAVTGADYARQYGPQFAGTDPSIQAMHESLKKRPMLSTFGTYTVWVRNAGFEARNLTFENGYRRVPDSCVDDCRASPRALISHQAVALGVDGADRARFEDVRLLGRQDTLFLKSMQDGGRPARMFFERATIEGDVDFIFGDATVFFSHSEIRSLGAERDTSFVGAPDTNLHARYGFVFDHCDFTHDGSANARAGRFHLARQWFHNQKCTPYGRVAAPGYACTLGETSAYAAPRGTINTPVLETVGKMVVLHSRIGAHIDKAQPWADWNQDGKLSYRPVQYTSDDYWKHLAAAGIDPVKDLGYAAKPAPALIFLGEFDNHDE